MKLRTGILLAAILGILAVTGAGYFFIRTYTVGTVYVEGNVHYTEDEIKEIVMAGPLGHNSLYLSLKYKNKGVEGIPFVDVMDVTILSPDTIRISVYEKALTGYVKYLDSCMYFDKDGYVVESSAEVSPGVPQITGLSFDHIVLGEQLPVEDPAVFQSILNMTKLLDKYELSSDKIYFQSNGNITLFFGNVKASLGSGGSDLEDKLMILPKLLPSLEGCSGTLQMENYSENGGRYIFQPDEEGTDVSGGDPA